MRHYLIFYTLTLVLLSTIFLSCTQLPVKYYFCHTPDKNCKLIARFDDMDTCKRYKAYASWYCDYVSTPGKIICETEELRWDGGSNPNYSSYCTY